VPGEERAVVEKGDGAVVLEHDVPRLLAGDDLTEPAIRVPCAHVRDTVRAGRGGEER
jgi:hypothetical protein